MPPRFKVGGAMTWTPSARGRGIVSRDHVLQPLASYARQVIGDLNAVAAADLDSWTLRMRDGGLETLRVRGCFPVVSKGLDYFCWGGPLEEKVFGGFYIDDLCAIALAPWPQLVSSASGGAILAKRADATSLREGWPRFNQHPLLISTLVMEGYTPYSSLVGSTTLLPRDTL